MREMYFNNETEEAIIAYIKESNPDKRNQIYEDKIHVALSKLVENIYNTFKFPYLTDGAIRVQQDCLTHVVTKIDKYDHTKGYKAYSYLSTVAKYYFILQNNRAYKKMNRDISIRSEHDQEGDDELFESVELPDDVFGKQEENEELQDFYNKMLLYLEREATKAMTSEKRMNLLRQFLNLMRERVDVETKKEFNAILRRTMNVSDSKSDMAQVNYSANVLRRKYDKFKKQYLKKLAG